MARRIIEIKSVDRMSDILEDSFRLYRPFTLRITGSGRKRMSECICFKLTPYPDRDNWHYFHFRFEGKEYIV